jgi:hypothetical protein
VDLAPPITHSTKGVSLLLEVVKEGEVAKKVRVTKEVDVSFIDNKVIYILLNRDI